MLCVQFGAYFWKLAFGTPGLYPRHRLEEKLRTLAAAGIAAYPGGTFLELAHAQGHGLRFLCEARELGFTAVEISDGSLAIPPGERRELIQGALELGLRVLTEVGKKDSLRQPAPAELIAQAECDLAAGAEFVIIEARESGRGIGIYDQHGDVRSDWLAELTAALPVQRLIWEAPDKGQQAQLIRRFGPEVHVGNVPPAEAMALEALRRGWRSDTIPDGAYSGCGNAGSATDV